MLEKKKLCFELLSAILEHCREYCEEGITGRGAICKLDSCPLYRYSAGGALKEVQAVCQCPVSQANARLRDKNS